MKNSAKARVGDNARIGRVSTRCEWKTLAFECRAHAQACK
jgi:hypothetical protein